MKVFTKYPHINQFHQIVYEIRHDLMYVGKDDENNPIFDESKIPSDDLIFEGTVKIHGTNSAVGYLNNDLWYQSRNNIIDDKNDNHGFVQFAQEKIESFKNIFGCIWNLYGKKKDYKYLIYGEFCGKGIQKDTAIQQLSKRFIIFDVFISKTDGSHDLWIPPHVHKLNELFDEKNNIYNIYQFPTFKCGINLKHPEDTIDEMTEATSEVEQECPVGKYFGVTGMGEGIVWRLINNLDKNQKTYRFKTRSDSKEKILIEPELFSKIEEFINYSVTKSRLEQGIAEVGNQDVEKYIKWMICDILREEKDTIKRNNFDLKIISRFIAKKAHEHILN